MRRFVFVMSLALRRVRAMRGRSALVALGVGLGVALMVAIRILNSAAAAALDENLTTLGTRVQLTVTGQNAGLPWKLTARLEKVPGVGAALPVVVGDVFVDRDEAALTLLGLDLTHPRVEEAYLGLLQDREIGPRGLDALILDRSVLLPYELAARLNLGMGDSLRLQTPTGASDLEVAGMLRLGGIGRVVAEHVAVVDLGLASRILVRGSRADRIDILSDGTVSSEGLADRLRAALRAAGEDALVAPPQEELGFRFQLANAFLAITSAVSTFGLIVGFFLIYNVLSAAIIAEAGELGRLRLQGASRRDLVLLLVAEAAVQAVPGIVVGCFLGVALAIAARVQFLEGLGMVTQMRLGVDLANVSWLSVVAIAGLGLPTAMAASWLAVHRRVSHSPLQSVIGVNVPELTESGSRLARRASLGLILVASVLVVLEMRFESRLSGMLAIAAVSALCVTGASALVLPAAGLLAAVFSRIRAVSASLASAALARAWNRTAVTVAVFTLGIGTAIATATIFHSARSLVLSVLRNHLRGDVVITSAFRQEGWLQMPLDHALAQRLRDVAGVRGVETERLLPMTFRGATVTVRAMEIETSGGDAPRWLFVAGGAPAARDVPGGDLVLISRNFAEHFAIGRGQTIQLEGPQGARAFEVAGVVEDFASPVGSIMMDRKQLAALTDDMLVNYVSVTAEPGRDLGGLVADIRQRIGAGYRLRILTLRDFLDSAERLVGQVFYFTHGVTAVALLIATISLLQSIISGALERRRVLAIMRAVGGSRRQLQASFVVEGAVLGAMGGGIGLIAAALLSFIWLRVHLRYLLGWSIPIDWPWDTYAVVGCLAVAWPALAAAVAAPYLVRLSRASDLVSE